MFKHLISILYFCPPKWDYRKILMRLINLVFSTDIFSKRRKICAWETEENPELISMGEIPERIVPSSFGTLVVHHASRVVGCCRLRRLWWTNERAALQTSNRWKCIEMETNFSHPSSSSKIEQQLGEESNTPTGWPSLDDARPRRREEWSSTILVVSECQPTVGVIVQFSFISVMYCPTEAGLSKNLDETHQFGLLHGYL